MIVPCISGVTETRKCVITIPRARAPALAQARLLPYCMGWHTHPNWRHSRAGAGEFARHSSRLGRLRTVASLSGPAQRGNPKVYGDWLILKALIIMLIRHMQIPRWVIDHPAQLPPRIWAVCMKWGYAPNGSAIMQIGRIPSVDGSAQIDRQKIRATSIVVKFGLSG